MNKGALYDVCKGTRIQLGRFILDQRPAFEWGYKPIHSVVCESVLLRWKSKAYFYTTKRAGLLSKSGLVRSAWRE